jgi:hypothetical protein
MSTWDKVSLRFIALVVAVVVLGYGVKFIVGVKQSYDAMSPEHRQQEIDNAAGK